MFALQDIDPDQELTFDYRISGVIMKEDIFCLCGSLQCTGFLGPIKSLPASPTKPAIATRNSTVHQQQPPPPDIAEIELTTKPREPVVKIEEEIVEKSIPLPEESMKEEELVLGETMELAVENCGTNAETENKIVHENFCYR